MSCSSCPTLPEPAPPELLLELELPLGVLPLPFVPLLLCWACARPIGTVISKASAAVPILSDRLVIVAPLVAPQGNLLTHSHRSAAHVASQNLPSER